MSIVSTMNSLASKGNEMLKAGAQVSLPCQVDMLT
jgi:hypothetical protein